MAAEEQVDKSKHLTVEEQTPASCGILGRYPVLAVLVFAGAGIAAGVGLSYWEPEDSAAADNKKILLQWLGLIGDLFIRALKAIVLPLVFVNVILSVVEMMSLGRTSSVAGTTILLYLLTTVIASVIGLVSILSFQSFFNEGEFEEEGDATIKLGCNMEGMFLTEQEDGSVVCAEPASDEDALFVIAQISSTFVRSSGGTRNDISLSDTFYDGVFRKLITTNIFGAFVSANFAAVVFFAIFFGVALGKVVFRKFANSNYEHSILVQFLREVDAVLILLINWVIMATPFAVFSLVVKAIGSQSDLASAFSNVGYLMAATIIAMAVHFFVVDIGLLTFFTRKSPFGYLSHILPAQATAFASASSAATIPVTLKSVASTGVVPRAIGNFVVPLGATINMDGGAIYFPCACIWLAFLNGETPNAASYFLLIILATVGSAGTAPVPSASLVLIITAYNTVFNTEGTPNGFEFILAIDWFMDRLRTTLNVTGDACVSGMVAARCKLDVDDDAAVEEDGGYTARVFNETAPESAPTTEEAAVMKIEPEYDEGQEVDDESYQTELA